MMKQRFLSRRNFMRRAAMAAGSLVLSACAGSAKSGAKTAPPQPVSTQTLEAYAQECERTSCYKGLGAFIDGFQLNDYTCVYMSQRTVVWGVKKKHPEDYAAEGKKIDAALGKIEAYLNRSISDYFKAGEKVHFFYGGTNIAFTAGKRYARPLIFMPPATDPYSFHNYAHEMTHLLTPEHADWVFEGVAVTLNDLYGEGGFPNYGQNVDQLSRAYLNRPEIMEHIGDESYYPTRAEVRTSAGQGFYMLSGSFVKYIIEKIGIAVFLQAYSEPNMQQGLEKTTNKTLPAWKTEWVSYLSGLK